MEENNLVLNEVQKKQFRKKLKEAKDEVSRFN